MSAYLIRHHIFTAPADEIFVTGDFLQYGPRATVDSSLARLVKREILERLADGVFVRIGSKSPTVEEIVKAKAKTFGKTVVAHCDNIAVEMRVGGHNHDPCLFGTDGPTSSFRTVHGTVRLIQTCGRKRSLADSKAGKAARALWSIKHPDAGGTETVMHSLNRDDRAHLKELIGSMPEWLGNQLVRRSLSRSIEKGAVFRPRPDDSIN